MAFTLLDSMAKKWNSQNYEMSTGTTNKIRIPIPIEPRCYGNWNENLDSTYLDQSVTLSANSSTISPDILERMARELSKSLLESSKLYYVAPDSALWGGVPMGEPVTIDRRNLQYSWKIEDKHSCSVRDCKDSERDFHRGILDYYRLVCPLVVSKIERQSGCKNLKCLIKQIKEKHETLSSKK